MTVAVLLAAASFGQAFQDLATNRDGTVLYFSSWLRLKGADQHPYPKIFAWTQADGVRLHAQRESGPLSPSAGGSGWSSLNAYRLLAPSVSADGTTIAFTGTRDCNWGTACAYSIERYEATIQAGASAPITLPGAAALSPNGRYAVLVSSLIAPGPQRARLLDLYTGQQSEVQGYSAGFPFRRCVANNGTVLAMYPAPGLWRAGERRTLPLSASARTAVINDAATRVVYSEWPYPGAPAPRLLLHDVTTGRETELAPPSALSTFAISDDATAIAYVQAGQAWVVRDDASGRRRLTEGPDSVLGLTLSGDGRVLFAATDSNRILRCDLGTAARQEIVPATPGASARLGFPITLYAVPGSLFSVGGESLPTVQQVRLCRRSIPVVSSSSTAVLLQIPWDIPLEGGAGWLELDLPDRSDNPFDSSFALENPVWLRNAAPTWFYHLEFDLLAAHQDFRTLVAPASPARPSEILHFYAVGLGPVSPQPPSGEPSPSDPLAILAEAMVCELEAGDLQTIEVLFAGLAPGMIGVYQVDVRLPLRLGRERGAVRCRVGADSFAGPGWLPLLQGN